MKKIFTTLAIALGISLGATAQTSTYFDPNYFQSCNSGTNTIVPVQGSQPGLSPADTALPCALRFASQTNDTIYFTNFTTSSGITVNKLKIDSLYLPAGLCWSTNKADNTFNGGESGVIYVTGLCTAPAGRYKLRIIVDITIPGPVVLAKQDAESLAGLRYYVRVTCPTGVCPHLDKTDSVHTFVADNSVACGGVGVNEVASTISELTVSPNPFAGTAHVAFSSEVEGTYTMKMTNLLGAVVSSKEVSVSMGNNNLDINSAGISAGVYMLTLSNGNGGVTKKVVVE